MHYEFKQNHHQIDDQYRDICIIRKGNGFFQDDLYHVYTIYCSSIVNTTIKGRFSFIDGFMMHDRNTILMFQSSSNLLMVKKHSTAIQLAFDTCLFVFTHAQRDTVQQQNVSESEHDDIKTENRYYFSIIHQPTLQTFLSVMRFYSLWDLNYSVLRFSLHEAISMSHISNEETHF